MILSLILPVAVLAIITGNSYSKTTVKTEIEGEGNVYTKIEAEVNGKKEILESSKEGEYRLELESENSSSPEEIKSPEPVSSASEIDEQNTQEIEKESEANKNFLQKIIDFFTRLFAKFL